MLDNMLPTHVAERLQAEASGFVLGSEELLVSVLFAEICDFHTIVATLSP